MRKRKPNVEKCVERLKRKIPCFGTLVGRLVKIRGAKAIQGLEPFLVYNYSDKNLGISTITWENGSTWGWDYGDIVSLLPPLSIEELLTHKAKEVRESGLFVNAVVERWMLEEKIDNTESYRRYCSAGEFAMKDIKARCRISKVWCDQAIKEIEFKT